MCKRKIELEAMESWAGPGNEVKGKRCSEEKEAAIM